MYEIRTTKKLLAITALIVVAATLISLPYQSQVANAAPPAKKYQVYVTLTDVPANADDLIVNATMLTSGNCCFGNFPEEEVSSPTNGDTVKFVLTLPRGSNELSVLVCGNTEDFSVSNCEEYPLPSKGGGPIRLEYPYPNCVC
jgi:hypothetical protein